MIVWGPFQPDRAGLNAKVVVEARNVLPGVSGLLPAPSLNPATDALASQCRGAVSIIRDDGQVVSFAGTQEALYKLSATSTWNDVSRLVGGPYNVGAGELWKFDAFGSNVLALNVVDGLQYIDASTGTNFAAVSGAPLARYIAVVRDFVVLGSIAGDEKRIQWCANNDITGWTPGVGESDYNDFPNGGPIRGLLGGEVGYIFQASKVTRMTYGAGSSTIFQMDPLENASGLAAPHSLVELHSVAYYLASDGFRKLDKRGGASEPIGHTKWLKWFLADIKPGTEISVVGAKNPVKPIIVWSYISKQLGGSTPNRLLIYDWSLDEATYLDVSTEALVSWLSPGISLDQMNPYGTLDTLPFSLDSPFWKGGAAVFGAFGTDHKLSLQSGANLEAMIVTGDAAADARVLVKGTKPNVDAAGVLVEISGRERIADAVTWGSQEAMEDTGTCPAHVSGNILRARVTIPAGQTWTNAQGIKTDLARRGKR